VLLKYILHESSRNDERRWPRMSVFRESLQVPEFIVAVKSAAPQSSAALAASRDRSALLSLSLFLSSSRILLHSQKSPRAFAAWLIANPDT